ncbi:hypothetical protein W02_06020 [Nitrospira sp. KM1]|uniref:hypothetical protein n=1 Tax=Nitrospira sp. KM1 TaxID=1936990 RepID=UPI0013A75142|nr:hypothetical protein [Nitrospira sp. KM1]BCA53462.1 hypothetical protein W02_06020 [Nitrospira sp. KM1]
MKPHTFTTVLTFVLILSVNAASNLPACARELDLEVYGMVSYGMTEAEVARRTGSPDQRIDQYEPTQLGQRVVSYQYVWNGDASKGEWTTTITFSSNTNKVVQIDRSRR